MAEAYSRGTAKQQLKANNILFTALFFGVVMFLLIAIAVIKLQGKFSDDDNFDKILLIVLLIIATVCMISASAIYKKRIRDTVNAGFSLPDKLNNYRNILIIYLALCEGAALFSVICLILTGNFWSIAVTTAMLAAMLFKRPTKQRVMNDLQLDWQEQQEL